VILFFVTYAACISAESGQILVTTTTTSVRTTTVTTAVIDLGICNATHHLYANGMYLKSLCMVVADLTYDQARSTCTAAGMSLFVINNNVVQNAIQEIAGVRFLDRNYARLWVNGVKNSEGNWETSEKESIFEGIEWLGGDKETGECLSILRRDKQDKMSFQGYTCSGGAWGYCEFIHPLKVEKKTRECNEMLMINDEQK